MWSWKSFHHEPTNRQLEQASSTQGIGFSRPAERRTATLVVERLAQPVRIHCWNHLAEAAPAFAVFEGWEPRMYAQGGIRPNARQAVGNPRPLKTAKDGAASFVVVHNTKKKAGPPIRVSLWGTEVSRN